MSIVKAAGYDPSVYLMDALPAGGFKGQPVYIQRQPVTFKENANRSRTMFFTHLAHGMGKIRELACWPVQDPMRIDLADGHALVTNHSRLDIVGEVGWPEVLEVRYCVSAPYGRNNATIDSWYDWFKIAQDGARERVARSELSATWAKVTGHGLVEPAPYPGYFGAFLEQMGTPAGEGPDFKKVFEEPARESLGKLDLGRELYRTPPGPKVRPILKEKIFETTLEESNMVGNIYFSNYYVWQGRVRDLFLFEHAPDVFRLFGSDVREEPVCLHSSVNHLREAMPFDHIGVTMALRALYECGADLYFEYFRVEPSGARVKLAYGEHRMAWLTRDEQWRPVAAALPESILNGFLSPTTASHG